MGSIPIATRNFLLVVGYCLFIIGCGDKTLKADNTNPPKLSLTAKVWGAQHQNSLLATLQQKNKEAVSKGIPNRLNEADFVCFQQYNQDELEKRTQSYFDKTLTQKDLEITGDFFDSDVAKKYLANLNENIERSLSNQPQNELYLTDAEKNRMSNYSRTEAAKKLAPLIKDDDKTISEALNEVYSMRAKECHINFSKNPPYPSKET